MKSYYFGLVVKVLLLMVFVGAIFFLLQQFGAPLFAPGGAKQAAREPKNILITLLEIYEKQLLANRTGLEQERVAFVDKLKAVVGFVQKREIENKLKEIDAESKKTNEVLVGTSNEKSNIQKREQDRQQARIDLQREKDRMWVELDQTRKFWNDYLAKIKDSLLAGQSDETPKRIINAAFANDYGLDYLTGVIKDYGSKTKELADLKAEANRASSVSNSQASIGTSRDQDIDRLNNQVKEAQSKNSSLQEVLTTREREIRNLRGEIEALLAQSGINGYFVGLDNQVVMVINKKKQAEILEAGTFVVYNAAHNPVSKIYLALVGGKIVMTKLPGYKNPAPGNWF